MTVSAAAGPAGSREMALALREVAGEAVEAVLLFGSHLVGASPDPHSAHDLVVLVDDYRRFYEALSESGHHRRSPRLLSGLARVLPPNVVAFFPAGARGGVAKCMILCREHFRAALSPEARDHFVKGRMVQRVAIVWARDAEVRRRVEESLTTARRDVLRWAGPFLEGPFTASELARRMLEVSYAGEVRPEASDRVAEVFEAQRPALERIYQEVLEGAAGEGEVEHVGDSWRLTSSPGLAQRLALRGYFLRSKIRATLRWFKHVLTFDDWLTYIQRKVERRTGMRIEITRLERRYPLILLWPKAVRVLRARPDVHPDGKGREAGDEPGGTTDGSAGRTPKRSP